MRHIETLIIRAKPHEAILVTLYASDIALRQAIIDFKKQENIFSLWRCK